MNSGQSGASFRDPSGFLFSSDGVLFRQINDSYSAHYRLLLASGLYDKLTRSGLLIPHRESDVAPADPELAFRVIQPDSIAFISYPYEWSFSQLKDAALATLRIQTRALGAGMTLKDASAYNIQFHHGQPTLIDTLSFEAYNDGAPWVAYRQFCQHFLAPLALMAYTDVRLSQLLRVYMDGVPLDLAARLLPVRTRFDFGLLTHIHLHAQAQRKYGGTAVQPSSMPAARLSKEALLGLVHSLQAAVQKLQWKPGGTEWADYYSCTNYSSSALAHKQELVSSWVSRAQPERVWDLGANDGTFSRLASQQGIFTVAFDIDPAAVEKNYHQTKSSREQNLLPLVMDLANPSPALGWHGRERESLLQRGPADMVFALALLHHLAISNNTPLLQLAAFFHDLGQWLVIEFVPKSDSQAARLLRSRIDIFGQYTREEFERIFQTTFILHERAQIRESQRFLYLMQRN